MGVDALVTALAPLLPSPTPPGPASRRRVAYTATDILYLYLC